MKFIFGELNQGAIGIVSIVFFSVLFVGLLTWVYRRAGRAGYDRLARLPLDDDTGGTR